MSFYVLVLSFVTGNILKKSGDYGEQLRGSYLNEDLIGGRSCELF
jgi:hypothetical protein